MENNWCIKLDDENRDVVIKYLNEKFRIELCDIELCGDRIYYGVYCNNIYCDDVVLETEINIKQFIEKIKLEGYNVDYRESINKYYLVTQGYKSEILSTSTNNPPISNFLNELDNDTKEVQGTPNYYDNSKGSLYQFAEHHKLNAWEFDIIKRVVRCREKGNFTEDLEKTKKVIDLYLKEYAK